MTEDCIKYCSKKSIYAYGGYEWTIPRLVLLYTWPKLQGFIDILVRLAPPDSCRLLIRAEYRSRRVLLRRRRLLQVGPLPLHAR